MATTTRTTDDAVYIPTKRLTLDELDQLAGLTRPGGTAMKPEARPLLCWDAFTSAQRRRWERVAGAAYDLVRQDVADARRRVEARRRPAEAPQR